MSGGGEANLIDLGELLDLDLVAGVELDAAVWNGAGPGPRAPRGTILFAEDEPAIRSLGPT
jgi:hypothetical protein